MESGPRIGGVLETILYCDASEMNEMRSFYEGILRLRPMWAGATMYRVAPGSVFLIFDRNEASVQKSPPPHGATGPVHACFVCAADDYEAWKERLDEQGIEIVEELTWRHHAELRSFYFRDPAGNMLEIAEGDIWPQA